MTDPEAPQLFVDDVDASDEDALQASAVELVRLLPPWKPPPAWQGVPYSMFKARSPTVTGKYGERLFAMIVGRLGIDVQAARSSDHDRMVRGVRTEIKTATLHPSGHFKFWQVRDQDYAWVALLGIYPSRIKCWIETKVTLRALGFGQHGGKHEHLTKYVTVPHDWPGYLSDGSLVRALEIVRGDQWRAA